MREQEPVYGTVGYTLKKIKETRWSTIRRGSMYVFGGVSLISTVIILVSDRKSNSDD